MKKENNNIEVELDLQMNKNGVKVSYQPVIPIKAYIGGEEREIGLAKVNEDENFILAKGTINSELLTGDFKASVMGEVLERRGNEVTKYKLTAVNLNMDS